MWFLPGAERFWDGNKSTGTFDACHYTPITATPGKATKADITFALTPGAPVLHQLGYGAFVTGLSGDGSVAVGGYGRGGPVFQWDAKKGVQSMNVAGVGGTVSISPNGRYISSNLLDVNSDTDLGAYRWDAKHGWLQVKPLGSCGTDVNWNMALSNDGSVYGVAYNTCTDYKAFRGNPNTSIGAVEYKSSFQHPDGTWANSRINQVSADGSTAVGWQEADWGGWLGTVWHNGVPELITDVNGDPVSEGDAVSGDGSIIAGENFDGQYPFDGSGWRRDTNSKNLNYVQPLNSDASPLVPYALNGDGSVMVGFSGSPWFSFSPAPFIWTKELGSVSLDDFVKHQGTSMQQWFSLVVPRLHLARTAPPSQVRALASSTTEAGYSTCTRCSSATSANCPASRKPSAWPSPRRSISTWLTATRLDVASRKEVIPTGSQPSPRRRWHDFFRAAAGLFCI